MSVTEVEGPRCNRGFLESYQLSEGPITVDLPPGATHWRTCRKHFRLYIDPHMGDKTMADLRPIPQGSTRVTIEPNHGNFSSNYQYKWE